MDGIVIGRAILFNVNLYIHNASCKTFTYTYIVRLRRIYFIHPQKMPRGRRDELILMSILHPKKMRFGQRGNLGFIHDGRLWAFENRAIRLNRRHPLDGHLSTQFHPKDIQKTRACQQGI